MKKLTSVWPLGWETNPTYYIINTEVTHKVEAATLKGMHIKASPIHAAIKESCSSVESTGRPSAGQRPARTRQASWRQS